MNTQTKVVKSILNYVSGSSSIDIAAGKHLPHVYSFGFFSFLGDRYVRLVIVVWV